MRDADTPTKGFNPGDDESRMDGSESLSRDADATLDEPGEPSVPTGIGASGPNWIGLYQLVKKLGEGGMGQVWLAEQSTPVTRRVALKLIKGGLYDSAVVQRFESERQSLAVMNHPTIAKVFDAGFTKDGQPYFVMEYVDGVSITRFCDKNKLKIRQRLELFIKVCEGVQHAHQKAIIHRDLKPSNILVEEVDGKPVPRIIDFGIAKAVSSQSSAEQTLFTQMGALVGTLGFMSPEQADPSVMDVDTRTDVYSLGVVLYLLLTGMLPFDSEGGKKRPIDEVLQQLRKEDPPSPSTKVDQDNETATAAAKWRGTGPRQLVKLLHGDLDWITLKAVEKDRARRYDTPSELVADLDRYLKNEPVLARPASTSYKLQKYVQRHRAGVGVAAGLFLLLVSFGVTEFLQARRIARERDRANLEAATAKETADFLVRLFEVSDPGEARGKSITAYEILNRASERIEKDLGREPPVRARLQFTMSQVYKGLGLYDTSVQLAERSWLTRRASLGENDQATLSSRSELGDSLRSLGKLDEAETHLRAVLEAQRRVPGRDALETLVTSSRLGVVLYLKGDLKQAESVLRATVGGLRIVGQPGTDELVSALQWLGQVLRDQDKRAEAVTAQLEALDLSRRMRGKDHPSTLSSLDALGLLYWDLGRLDEAESYLRESLEASRRVLGPDHPDTLTTTLNLGLVLTDREKKPEAEAAYRAALEGYQKVLGPDHAYTLTAMSNLCSILTLEKKLPEAETYCRQSLAGRRRTLGEDHLGTLHSLNALGSFFQASGRLQEAEFTYREAFERRRRVLGPDHASTLISMGNLGDVILDRGRVDDAAQLLRVAAEKARATLPKTDSTLPSLLTKWGRCLALMHRTEEAKSTLTEAVQLYEKTLGAQNSRTKNAQKLLAKLE
jgi:serine/threonine protein kinase/Flp pilus assembly protein TadD